jgi:capsule biosynthesis phosphatase
MDKIIIIPIGGLGNRFKNAGYIMPKPLVNVMGNPIIYWLLENLDLTQIEYIYIPYNKELKKYRFEDQLKKDFPHINFKFYCLENNTRGAAETIKIALENLKEKNDKHVMCIDSDNFYTENIISHWNGNNMIYTFEDYFTEPIFSYIKTNTDNILVDIKEKCKISNNACSGIYAFSSLYKLFDSCKYIVLNNIMDKNEFYMSVVVKHMVTNGDFFYNKQINKENYHCLGTPLQVKIFCNNFQKVCNRLNKNLMKIKRFCFDLDNTLVTFPKINGDYSTVEPIKHNIKTVQYLKNLGHTIIIYTARKMKSSGSNIGNAVANVGKITFDTLEKFNIPYDEIYFGKPYADYYIDDLAISSFENLEKALGFHETEIEPRDYNQIKKTDFEIIKKKSENLNGEIYYYKNIPSEIKHLFPIFVNNDNNNTWYQIEKINGVSVSKLYLAGEFTTNILNNIIDCIKSIQNCIITESQNNINIYANYKTKLKERFENYDYSKFEESKKMYIYLYTKLEKYEQENKGKITVIHGDPVFTNILLDQYNTIKFIDMRGKLGNDTTIYGDWIYDWAKIYQSLIGYDEILDDVDLDLTYKNTMIDFFKQEFIKIYSTNDFENLKLITKSLLFTLIPLHNNDKCYKYYDLINSSLLS